VPLPSRTTEYVEPLTEPVKRFYQDIPGAPGSPSVPEMTIPSPESGDLKFVTMQMDNGTVAYVPLSPSSPEGRRLMISAPSSGGDTRYTQARAADGSVVSVARGYPLPPGVVSIPGVTGNGAVNVQTPNGETFVVPEDVIMTAVEEEKKNNGVPWLLLAGIGVGAYLLFGGKKKSNGDTK
jgi:hypothetical protein